uniref:Fibronectin type-III domain-containing protein n=1 Tax=Hyaloperonospora arabidopsidis (strain Emoy2) TaxID=559515 RepID=M4BD62_HYAAE
MESLSIRYPQEQSRRSSALLRHVRHRSSSSSSLSVSACSISSTVSNYPPSNKLGLTLKSHEHIDPLGHRIPETIVKSTIFSVGQVSHPIRIAPRPIRLRFRTKLAVRRVSGAEQQEVSARRSSWGSIDSDFRVPLAAGAFLFPERPGLEEDRDDSDSQDAVVSESFGDADSACSTENSSVITEFGDMNLTSSRQSSRLAAFLRKPFRRDDGFYGAWWEPRFSAVPTSPRTQITLDSPLKAAIHVRWCVHAKAVSYHVQFSRDWTMKVWKNWSGRPVLASDSDCEMATTIFGLDYSKSYVVRVRYEFSGGHGPGEWSTSSAPVTTINHVDAMHHRIARSRARRG